MGIILCLLAMFGLPCIIMYLAGIGIQQKGEEIDGTWIPNHPKESENRKETKNN